MPPSTTAAGSCHQRNGALDTSRKDGALFPHLSVQANIGFGMPRRGRAAKARLLAELVGLADLVKRRPHELSGGQQRRVALARALAIKPDLVLLDEPFASLDAALRGSVRTDVFRVLRAAGTTTVLVTHDQDEAFDAADTVAVLRDGAIAQHATPRELYTEPADCDLARMIGHANLIPTDIEGDHATSPLGRHPIRGAGIRVTTGAAVILLRPEQLDVRCRNGGPGLTRAGLRRAATTVTTPWSASGPTNRAAHPCCWPVRTGATTCLLARR